jgi:hypothetical protein
MHENSHVSGLDESGRPRKVMDHAAVDCIESKIKAESAPVA